MSTTNNNIPIPEAAAAVGMTALVFEDDFESLDTIALDGNDTPEHKWFTRCYGHQFKPEDVELRDSYIHMGGASYGLCTYSRPLDTGFTVTSGTYLEVRMRAGMPTGEYGGIPAFWTIGLESFMGRSFTHAGELDVVELFITKNKDGEDQKYFAGTLHDHYRTGEVLENGRLLTKYGTNLVNATGYLDQFPFIGDEWHIYGALWEKGRVAWYMDGKLMHSAEYTEDALPEYYYRDDPTPLPRAKEVWPDIKREEWVGCHSIMDTDTGVVLLTSRTTYPMDVDWVRIWRRPEK